MLGTVGFVRNLKGVYLMANKVNNVTEIRVPSASRILCTNCTISNESTLISNGTILKTEYGYNILKDVDLSITKENTIPLTVVLGRDLIYIDGAISGSDIIFNLPRGARLNQIKVESTGEIAIASTDTYFIEY